METVSKDVVQVDGSNAAVPSSKCHWQCTVTRTATVLQHTLVPFTAQCWQPNLKPFSSCTTHPLTVSDKRTNMPRQSGPFSLFSVAPPLAPTAFSIPSASPIAYNRVKHRLRLDHGLFKLFNTQSARDAVDSISRLRHNFMGIARPPNSSDGKKLTSLCQKLVNYATFVEFFSLP